MNSSLPFINRLEKVSTQYAEKNAFCINGKTYSYAQFYGIVKCIAQKLTEHPAPNKRVLVVTNNDIETYASIVAIWLTGNTYIPFNMEENNKRQQTVMAIVNADLLLTSTSLNQDNLPEIKICRTDALSASNSNIPAAIIDKNAIAYILFTSGTTGVPKGVPISYQNLDAFVSSFLSLGYDFTAADHFLQMADLTFDMSIISTLIPLCIGASITTIDPQEIKYLTTYKALTEQAITVLVTAPSTLQLLAPYYSEINLPALKYTFVGAEAFYESTAYQWQQCAPNSKIVNLYGPSEGGILATTYIWDKDKTAQHQGIVSIGKPVQHLNLYLVDDNGDVLTHAGEGEAWISGRQVFDSYWDVTMNEGQFSHLLIDGKQEKCFKTGDLLLRAADGNLFYCGRKDQQVKIQGKRIELREIEFYSGKFPGKFQPVALPYQGDLGLKQIALFVDKDIPLRQLTAELKRQLPSYMIPSRIIGLDALPLNKNQKVDKTKLAALLK